MWIRKLVITALLVCAPASAHAEVGIGLFVGEPTGLDVKLGLSPRSALDILVGWHNQWDDWRDDGAYGHLTYLLQPYVGYGDAVYVPLRVGIGIAVFDDYGRDADDLNVGARVPFQIGLQFRSVPLEIYGEVSVLIAFIDNDRYNRAQLDGGIGIRFYF